MPAKLGGVEQYLFSVLQGTVGISAKDGRQLWHFPFKFNVSVSPSPLAIDGERVYVTAAYDSGGAMFRVKRDGEGFTTETVFGHGALGIASAIITLLILFLSEIIPKTIGAKNIPALSFPFQGYVDELRISNVARSADWIRVQQLAQASEPIHQPGSDALAQQRRQQPLIAPIPGRVVIHEMTLPSGNHRYNEPI